MNKDSTYIYSLQNLESLAKKLHKKLLNIDILTLTGNLGAGKTTLSKELIHQKLGICKHDITSPTYTYVNTYQHNNFCINHFDLYRLDSIDAFNALGLGQELEKADLNIIEWPSILEPILDSYSVLNLDIHYEGQDQRKLIFKEAGVANAL